MSRSPLRLALFCNFAAVVLLSGCSPSLQQLGAMPGKAVSGHIFGGQQPVTASSVQLYAVSTSATGGTSTTELTTAVTTSDGSGVLNANANAGNGNNTLPAGFFTITGDYACPAPDAQVYLAANGGNPGLAGNVNNAGLSLMAALGSCGSLTASTNIQINEVTTVAAVAALFPYMTAYNAVGSPGTTALALETTFGVAGEYANLASGTAPGATLPSGYYASSVELNTLADAIASCVNSQGNTGSGSPCNTLFQAATPANGAAPTETVGALINILKNPTANVGTLYSLVTPQAPFLPALSSAPADWTLPILPVPSAPRFSPAAGMFAASQSVSLVSATSGATIFYTTDGSAPTKSSSVYTGALTVSANETIRAVAVNRTASSVSSAAYTITGAPAAPSFSLAAGAYAGPQIVSIVSPTPDAAIYFTTNGTTPTTSSTLYTGPLQVSTTATVNAVAVSGNARSNVSSAAYTLTRASGTIYTFAGGSVQYDNLPATTVGNGGPVGVVADANGNVYYADGFGYRVRRISPAGIVTTVAGTGTLGFSGDGGPATSAQVYNPRGLALDSAGNLYFADANNHRVRMVSASTGYISTVAGNGTAGYVAAQDGGPATSAQLNYPYDVAVDTSGNLYIADSSNDRIRKVTASTGNISTIAGTGATAYNGDNQAASAANLNIPRGVTVDSAGNLYIAETSGSRIRFLSAVSGYIYTIAGNGSAGFAGDGGAATSAKLQFPFKAAVDVAGNVYIADSTNFRIRKVTASTGNIATIAGTGISGSSGDGGAATSAAIGLANGVAVDPGGNVYLTDSSTYRVREINASTGNISTVAGNGTSISSLIPNNVPAVQTRLAGPNGMVFDAAGNLYFADYSLSLIRKVSATTGTVSTIAGTGTTGYSGDGGPAASAQIWQPTGLAVDTSGNLYFGDSANNVIRTINLSSGTINTFAGTGGVSGFSGDGGQASAAKLNQPAGLAFDTSGNLYFADYGNQRVRVISQAGVITTIAGTGTAGYTAAQDGGAATSATLNNPRGVAVDGSRNVYIADSTNNRIRKVANGIITTVAGTGTGGYVAAQDGGAASSAQINYPRILVCDAAGNVYFADTANSLVRKINVAAGTISTIAGTGGSAGFAGDGGAATGAKLSNPFAVTFDGNNNLYIADYTNGRIRVVYP